MAKVKQDDQVNQIVKDIKTRSFKPIYFFTGDEPYYIDKLSEFIENNVLNESERDFNQVVLYGADTNVTEILATAKRFPMMAEHQVVVVREAQGISDFNTESGRTALAAYAKNPQDSTILVFNYKYKKADGRKPFIKTVKKSGVFFESKKKYDNELPDWIAKVLRGKGYTIEQKATFMLVEFLGNDLSKIAGELEKLTTLLEKGTQISPQHIEENIGISKEFNNFELNSALANRDVLKANRIINYFAHNQKQHPVLGTIPSIFGYFSKVLILHSLKDKSQPNVVAGQLGVHPFFVKEYFQAANSYNLKKAVQIVSYLRDADVKVKGVGANAIPPGEILKELVFKILH
ncbi:MAG: DNA polymerase III subunit delta [Bacteroidota bacterium]